MMMRYLLAFMVLLISLTVATSKSIGGIKGKSATSVKRETEPVRHNEEGSGSSSESDEESGERSGRQIYPSGTYPLFPQQTHQQQPQYVIQNSGVLGQQQQQQVHYPQGPVQHQQHQTVAQYHQPQPTPSIAYVLATGLFQPTIYHNSPSPSAPVGPPLGSASSQYGGSGGSAQQQQQQTATAKEQSVNPWLALALSQLADFAQHPFLGEQAAAEHQQQQLDVGPSSLLPFAGNSVVSIARPMSNSIAGPQGESEAKAEGEAHAGPGASALALPQAISIVGPGGIAIASSFGNANAIGGSVVTPLTTNSAPLSDAPSLPPSGASPPGTAPGTGPAPPGFRSGATPTRDAAQRGTTAGKVAARSGNGQQVNGGASQAQQPLNSYSPATISSPYSSSAVTDFYAHQLLPALLQQLYHSTSQHPILIAQSVGGVPVVYQAYRVQ